MVSHRGVRSQLQARGNHAEEEVAALGRIDDPIAFALAHFGTYGVPQLVLGLMSGWLFAKSRGLWPSILAHALHNGLVLLLMER